jgi:ribosome modulation factor
MSDDPDINSELAALRSITPELEKALNRVVGALAGNCSVRLTVRLTVDLPKGLFSTILRSEPPMHTAQIKPRPPWRSSSYGGFFFERPTLVIARLVAEVVALAGDEDEEAAARDTEWHRSVWDVLPPAPMNNEETDEQGRWTFMVGVIAFAPGEPQPENPYTNETHRDAWVRGWEWARARHAEKQN